MKLYRIYTEYKERGWVEEFVTKYFKGFSIIEAAGYYKGQGENSIIIEIVAPCTLVHVLRFMCACIAQHNEQECVLLTEQSLTSQYVRGNV